MSSIVAAKQSPLLPERSLRLYSDEHTHARYYNDFIYANENGTLPALRVFRVHLGLFDIRLLNECKFLLAHNPFIKTFHIEVDEIATKSLYTRLLDFVFLHPRPSLTSLSLSIPAYDDTNVLLNHLAKNSNVTSLHISLHCIRFGQSLSDITINCITNLTIDGFWGPIIDDSIFDSIQMPRLASIHLRRVCLTKRMSSFLIRHSSTITSLTIHTTTVKWPLHSVLSNCTHLQHFNMHLMSSAPLSLSHNSIEDLSLDGLYLDEQNVLSTSSRLSRKLYCFIEEAPSPFPSLKTIHFPHFQRSSLSILKYDPNAYKLWENILYRCNERNIVVMDEDDNAITFTDL